MMIVARLSSWHRRFLPLTNKEVFVKKRRRGNDSFFTRKFCVVVGYRVTQRKMLLFIRSLLEVYFYNTIYLCNAVRKSEIKKTFFSLFFPSTEFYGKYFCKFKIATMVLIVLGDPVIVSQSAVVKTSLKKKCFRLNPIRTFPWGNH